MGDKKKKEGQEKPLDKMTVKELRDIAKGIEGIVGVHGMNKGDLLVAIKEARGIKDEIKKKSGSVRAIKAKIKAVKTQRREALTAEDRKKAYIYRRQISRLKKKSRQAA
jgi:hypothetical protein